MNKRLFIAINLPLEIKRRLTQIITQINAEIFPRQSASGPRSSAWRWLPPENWHLTISFLGEQSDETIQNILKSIETTTRDMVFLRRPRQELKIEFEKIVLGPPNKPPRMIWLTGTKETSRMLGEIRDDLENNLIKNGVRFQPENREYNAHLTLVRFKSIFGTSDVLNIDKKLRDIGCPEIEKLSFIVQSLDLMESHLKRTGAEYEILASCKFAVSMQ